MDVWTCGRFWRGDAAWAMHKPGYVDYIRDVGCIGDVGDVGDVGDRYIITYGLGIYLLNNFIGFLSPLAVSQTPKHSNTQTHKHSNTQTHRLRDVT